jgi:large subunit ribosomal protein L6
MKKDLFQEIEIPGGVEVNLEGTEVSVKGPEGEVKRKFKTMKIKFEKKENQIIIGAKKSTKKEKKIINTIVAHVKNMIEGVQNTFEYKLKVASSHFPISLEVSEDQVLIKNFLGEKIPRTSKIIKGCEFKLDGQIITINSPDKEIAGQTAANLEAATKIKKRDLRVFQDGIYITHKPKGEI